MEIAVKRKRAMMILLTQEMRQHPRNGTMAAMNLAQAAEASLCAVRSSGARLLTSAAALSGRRLFRLGLSNFRRTRIEQLAQPLGRNLAISFLHQHLHDLPR